MYWLPYSSHTSHHPSQTPWLLWISYATEKLMFDSYKMVEKQSEHSIRFCGIFPSLKHNFIAYCFSKLSSRPDCIFKIHQLWQSGFIRLYSNSRCSCSLEPGIIKIGQLSHEMYSYKILNFQESTTILNACAKKGWKLIEGITYISLNTFGIFLHISVFIRFVWTKAFQT